MKKILRSFRTVVRALCLSPKNTTDPPQTSFPYKPLLNIPCFVIVFLVSCPAWAQQWQFLANEQVIASATSSYTNIAMVSDGLVSIPYKD